MEELVSSLIEKTKNTKIAAPTINISENVNKWLLASNLQKAVRRGEPQLAIKTAAALWQVDKNYLLWRYRTILIEDLGLTCLDTLNQGLALCHSKVAKKEPGFIDMLLANVSKAAELPKDRSGSDYAWHIGTPSLKNKRDTITKYNYDELVKIVKNEDGDVWERVIASWMLIGTKLIPNEQLKIDVEENEGFSDGCGELYLETMAEMAIMKRQPELMKTMRLCVACQKESHFIPFPMIMEKIEKGTEIREEFIESPRVGPYLLAAADAHTSIGKGAVKEVLRDRNIQRLMKENGVPEEKWESAIKRTVFVFDGGRVRKRLVHQLTDQGIRKTIEWVVGNKLAKNQETILAAFNKARSWRLRKRR